MNDYILVIIPYMCALRTCVCHNRQSHKNNRRDGDTDTSGRERERASINYTTRFVVGILASLAGVRRATKERPNHHALDFFTPPRETLTNQQSRDRLFISHPPECSRMFLPTATSN